MVREEAFTRKGHSLEKSSGSRGGVHWKGAFIREEQWLERRRSAERGVH